MLAQTCSPRHARPDMLAQTCSPRHARSDTLALKAKYHHVALLLPQLRAWWRKVVRGGSLPDPYGGEEHPIGALCPAAGRMVRQDDARGDACRTPTAGRNTPVALLFPQLRAWWRKVAGWGIPAGPLRRGGTPRSW
eukprot:gene14167-biopygen1021